MPLMNPTADDRGSPRWRILAAWLVLAAASVLAYLPCLNGGVLWNDPDYLTAPALRSLHGLWRIWFEVGATQQYYPLLHSAFWVEHRLWGDSMLGYHLANVLLHAGVAGLLGLLLRRLSVPGAFLASLIFALHPVFVESVAWVTEQKNTLSGVFFLLAALAFLRWRERPGAAGYLLATLLFAAAVLSKTVTAPLPAALLVILWWKNGRLSWRNDVLPLVPWFGIGAAGGLFSAWVEKIYIGADGDAFSLSLGQRFLIAGRDIWFYLGKMAWPADLIFIYPRWEVSTAAGWQWVFPLAALALAAVLWGVRRSSRAPLAALLLFTGLLFPILGFFKVYAFLYSFVADHFAYLPGMAFIALIAAGWGQALEGCARRRAWATERMLRAGAAAVVCALGVLTWRESRTYADVETFYRTIISRNPDCWMAHNNLGLFMGEAGRYPEAIAEYREAMRLHPEPMDHYNIGVVYADEGRLAEAVGEFSEAIRLKPKYPEALFNRAVAYGTLGRIADAIAGYREALRADPNFAEAHNGLGFTLTYTGNVPEGISECAEAVRLSPGSRDARFNLGYALAAAHRYAEAIASYAVAERLDPAFPEVHRFLGVSLAATGRFAEAADQFREALRLRPGDAAAQRDLDDVLRLGQGSAPAR